MAHYPLAYAEEADRVRRISVPQPDRRRGIPFTRLAAPGLLISLLFLAAGCIRPAEKDNPTATPGGILIPSPIVQTPLTPGPITSDGSNNLIRMEAFVQSYGAQPVPGSTRVWVETTYLQDLIVGIVFQNPSGLPCIGVGIGQHDGGNNGTTAVNLINVFTGGYHCATDPAGLGIAGQWLVTDSTGGPLVIFAGQIATPTAQSVALVFPNRDPYITQLSGGSFILLDNSLNFPTEVIIRDATEAEIGRIPIPVSPQG